MDELNLVFEVVRNVVRQNCWPGIEESTSYGTPALKVRGKLILRLSEADIFVLPCPVEEKLFLIDMAPEIYFQTPHYECYPWILARASLISVHGLKEHIEQAWLKNASKRQIQVFEKINSSKLD